VGVVLLEHNVLSTLANLGEEREHDPLYEWAVRNVGTGRIICPLTLYHASEISFQPKPYSTEAYWELARRFSGGLVLDSHDDLFAKELVAHMAGFSLPLAVEAVSRESNALIDELEKISPGGRVDPLFSRLARQAYSASTWHKLQEYPLDRRAKKLSVDAVTAWYPARCDWIAEQMELASLSEALLPTYGKMAELPCPRNWGTLHAHLIEGRVPEPGDFMDLAYGPYLPYVDVFITDRKFANIIKTSQLANSWGTKVLGMAEARSLAEKGAATSEELLLPAG
jgi:hypothetical protein